MEQERGAIRYAVLILGVAMSIYHLYIAYSGGYEPLYQRSLSFLFAAALIFIIYRRPSAEKAGVVGHLVAGAVFLLAVSSVGWILWNYTRYIDRFPYIDPPSAGDLFFGTVAILIVLESSRRTINLALPAISLAFLLYTYFGPYMPWELAHPGATFPLIIDHQYMGTEGLWSIPLGVFSVYIYLFILFGAFLDRMGAADFYVQLSMGIAGRLRGGPAKAAIVASAMMGTITGSTNANVVTTGTFTIPMMKRTGFKPEFAAGVETAASTGGQIIPPVMGVAAFLIAEFTGTPYWEIVKVSILPAILYLFSIYAMVHLEARKEGLVGLPRKQLPPLGKTLKEGWFFLIPPGVIIYYMMLGRTVPYSGLAGIVSVVILGGLKGILVLLEEARLGKLNAGEILTYIRAGIGNVFGAMEQGARASLPIAAACATVGIVIGALFQTGLGNKFSTLVISLAHGNLFLGIILVGISSFVLGMGLPTSAAYIVLSVMAVPALLELGESVGLTLLAAHLIVFWYSLDSCFTPPVCVPAYTAAGIANANPSKSAWNALKLAKGMYVLPFMFAYTPILDIGSPMKLIETFVAAALGFTALAAGLQAHIYFPLSLWKRGALIAAGICLFWPARIPKLVGLLLLGCFVGGQWLRLTRERELDSESNLIGVSYAKKN